MLSAGGSSDLLVDEVVGGCKLVRSYLLKSQDVLIMDEQQQYVVVQNYFSQGQIGFCIKMVAAWSSHCCQIVVERAAVQLVHVFPADQSRKEAAARVHGNQKIGPVVHRGRWGADRGHHVQACKSTHVGDYLIVNCRGVQREGISRFVSAKKKGRLDRIW